MANDLVTYEFDNFFIHNDGTLTFNCPQSKVMGKFSAEKSLALWEYLGKSKHYFHAVLKKQEKASLIKEMTSLENKLIEVRKKFDALS